MTAKTWSTSEIRTIARQTVEGQQIKVAARGAYFRALIETTQAELAAAKSEQLSQLTVLRRVHLKFYPVVQEAVTTEDIAKNNRLAKDEQRRRALKRNARTNFARTAYGAIRRWLRASGHDLMTLNAAKVTKGSLEADSPPTRKHALTPERIQSRADKLIDQVVRYAKQVAKMDAMQGARVLSEAVERLYQHMRTIGIKSTADAGVAAQEGRPLRIGKTVFIPTEIARSQSMQPVAEPARGKAANG